MNVLRTWALVGALAAAIGGGWALAEWMMARWQDRHGEFAEVVRRDRAMGALRNMDRR